MSALTTDGGEGQSHTSRLEERVISGRDGQGRLLKLRWFKLRVNWRWIDGGTTCSDASVRQIYVQPEEAEASEQLDETFRRGIREGRLYHHANVASPLLTLKHRSITLQLHTPNSLWQSMQTSDNY